MDPQVGQSLDDLSFRQKQFWVKILRWVGGPIPQLEGGGDFLTEPETH